MQNQGLNGLRSFINDSSMPYLSLEVQTVSIYEVLFDRLPIFPANSIRIKYHSNFIIMFSCCLCFYVGRGNAKDSNEGDANSWAYSIPPEKPFAGIFFFLSIMSVRCINFFSLKIRTIII